MDTKKQKLGQELFLKACELPTQEWPEFINENCKDDDELRNYIEDLLLSLDSSNEYFEDFEQSISSSQLNEIDDHLFRDIDFGNYQIISVMKQGGMGSLFLARRADGEFEREVVIKMIPIDLNSHFAQNQFSHEKEILASLSHPNIVQLYDSGVTKKGQSYFVMELVKGKTLIKFCNDNALTIDKRIALFAEVLQAVGFAHQHLVIHGDIKPSNIMVNEEGQIKLLDFGISRLINSSDVRLNGYSLNYLTPEHKNKTTVITTTDIHQLGQLLFELTTGIAPKKARSKDFDFPLVSFYSHNHSISIKSQSTDNQIRKSYNSDLQYIIAKALSPEPKNRYGSVQAFEEDLKRYNQGYCISARDNTLAYRISKYVFRNKVLSVSMVSILLLSTVFSLIVLNKNKTLIKERDKALKLKYLVTDVFSAADPSTTPGKELTAVEVLDMGLQRVRDRFDGISDTEADLLTEMAVTYQNLGKYQKAQDILHQVFEIKKKLHANNNQIHAHVMLLLGENYRLMSQNKEAKKILNQSLEILQLDKENNKMQIASAKSNLGRVMVLMGDFNDAEKQLNQSTLLSKEIYGEHSLEYAQALNGLNSVYFRQGKYKQVQKLLTQTKTIREYFYAEKKGPILDKDYATNINNLGLAYYLDGNLKQGEIYFRQANDLRNKIYVKPHPDQAQSLTNLGLLLNDSGRADEALLYLQQALTIRKKTLNAGHMRINAAMNNLAMVYHENQEFEKAENIYTDIYPKILNVRSEKHPQALAIMTNRANTLLELNQNKFAHDLFEKTLTIRLESLPEDHIYLSYSYLGLGKAKMALGDFFNAEKLIDKALKIRQNKLPKDNWLLGEAYYIKALINQKLNKQDSQFTSKACEILTKAKGKRYFLTQRCHNLLTKISPE
jgi:serine/threonine-protein kinase